MDYTPLNAQLLETHPPAHTLREVQLTRSAFQWPNKPQKWRSKLPHLAGLAQIVDAVHQVLAAINLTLRNYPLHNLHETASAA